MFFTLKLLAYFTLSFAILCLPINNKPLFNILYAHFGQEVVKTINIGIDEGKKLIFPTIVNAITSEPKNIHSKGLHTRKYFITNKRYTSEEKNLMIKVLDKE